MMVMGVLALPGSPRRSGQGWETGRGIARCPLALGSNWLLPVCDPSEPSGDLATGHKDTRFP